MLFARSSPTKVMESFFHFFGTPIVNKPIIVVKNWLDDSRLNCTTNSNFKDYVKFKVIVKENYEFIEESEYFEELLIDND
jgi:hypothetical protein